MINVIVILGIGLFLLMALSLYIIDKERERLEKQGKTLKDIGVWIGRNV